MNEPTELFTIGQLARATGLTTRTIRFYSDSGLLPPVERTRGGYRVYDAAAVARLELVRTLRELGMDLPTVAKVLAQQVTVADVAQTHVTALDAEIRQLTVRRAVWRSVVRRAGTTEELRLMNDLARLSAGERQRVLDEFVQRVFEGTDPEAPGAGLAKAMRQLPAELPADPTSEQVDAWVELAELVADPDFEAKVRGMAVAGSSGNYTQHVDPAAVTEHAGAALAAGIDPAAPEARAHLDRIVAEGEDRLALADMLDTFTDRRVGRYWALLGILNGWPPRPEQEDAIPAFEWLIAALRAHA